MVNFEQYLQQSPVKPKSYYQYMEEIDDLEENYGIKAVEDYSNYLESVPERDKKRWVDFIFIIREWKKRHLPKLVKVRGYKRGRL